MCDRLNPRQLTINPTFSRDIWGLGVLPRTPGPGHMAIQPGQVFRQVPAIVAGHLQDGTTVDPWKLRDFTQKHAGIHRDFTNTVRFIWIYQIYPSKIWCVSLASGDFSARHLKHSDTSSWIYLDLIPQMMDIPLGTECGSVAGDGSHCESAAPYPGKPWALWWTNITMENRPFW